MAEAVTGYLRSGGGGNGTGGGGGVMEAVVDIKEAAAMATLGNGVMAEVPAGDGVALDLLTTCHPGSLLSHDMCL